MAKENINSKKGFTIIEVVLVLAIAGLIFLMVFVALPALQRSQRDTQRRQDYADFSAAISSYITNNNGRLPTTTTTLEADRYINSTGEDPNGTKYTIQIVEATNALDSSSIAEPTEGVVVLYTHANCDETGATGNAAPGYDARSKAYAIYGYLESGSYCQSSN